MTAEFWLRIRKLLRKRSKSREIERIVVGWRAGEADHDPRRRRQRERFDLIEGWVSEDIDHDGKRTTFWRPDRALKDRGNKTR